MVMSQRPGSIFCNHSSLTKQLKSFASNNQLKKIIAALGVDADLHIVGGLLRNFAEGAAASDCDLATKLYPELVAERCKQAGLQLYSTGLEHGTVTIHIDGENFEVTTFRTPGPRNQSVFSEDIATDLSGRDFTINAIAFSLNSLELLDPFDGLEDLKAKKLRAVGSANERIAEDPLRIMRMIRFGPAAGFAVEEDLSQAAKECCEGLKSVSPERIRVELEKLIVSEYSKAALQSMLDLGIMEVVLPEIIPAVGFEQNDFHTEDVFEHTLSVVEQAAPYLSVRLAALFHDLGKPHTLSIGEDGRRHFFNHERVSAELTGQIMQRLKFSKKKTKSVTNAVALHMRPLDCGPAGVRLSLIHI